MTQQLQARPTTYKGIKMRSRLEAHFAQYCDEEEWEWQYEPNAFGSEVGQYLPDFVTHHAPDSDRFFEVKPPNADLDGALVRMHIILASLPTANLYVMCPGVEDYKKFFVHRRCLADDGCGHCDREPAKDNRDVIAFTYEQYNGDTVEQAELVFLAHPADIQIALSVIKRSLAAIHGDPDRTWDLIYRGPV